MAKVTSKRQLTVPKAIADQYGIRPGDDLDWIPAGDAIRVLSAGRRASQDVSARLTRFDQATVRQRRRQRTRRRAKTPANRGWTRENLYARGRAR